MQTTNRPEMMPVPFADTGSKQTIPVDSQIGITAGRASYVDGFPPLTRTPLAAGGIPPFGTDMNGILHAITEAVRWQQAGAGFPFSADFAASVGGYPSGAVVCSSDNLGAWVNLTDGNSNNPETTDGSTGDWSPGSHVGVTTQALSGSSVTLSALSAAKPRLILTGTLTANVNLTVPTWSNKSWDIVNNCTGAFSVTVKTSAGSGVSIAVGQQASVYCDGSNIQYKNLLAANALVELRNLGLVNQTLANLGLGNAATKDIGTTAGTVAAGDDPRITGALQKDSNLSELSNSAAARNNLGLGTAATKSVGTGSGQVPDMSAFTRGFTGNGSAFSGFFSLPGGLIVQYGKVALYNSSVVSTINLPLSYADGNFAVIATSDLAVSGNVVFPWFGARPHSASQIDLQQSTSTDGYACYWVTIGRAS